MANPEEPRCTRCFLELFDPLSACPRCELDPSQTAIIPRAGEAEDIPEDEVPLGFDPEQRYRVIDTIGRGGMAIVYRVHDRELDEVIALKVLAPLFGTTVATVERFKQEVKVARRINHPNVARLFDIFIWRKRLAISQEYIEGRSLESVLAEGPLPLPSLRRYARYLCSALAAAHEVEAVHRDLKPANVLIDRDDRPRILDFGLAFFKGQASADEDDYIMGTPSYMAPEQAFDVGNVDHRADLYSLGVLLFRMATGEVPFTGSKGAEILFAHLHQPPRRPCLLRPGLPAGVEEVILRCLEKSPAARFASAREVYRRLESAFVRELPGSTEDRTFGARGGKRGKVLLIDDDEDVRLFMRSLLRALDVSVLEAPDGRAGVAKALDEMPDLVLLDILMPELDGRETLRILKSNPKTRRIPVVMVTGLTDDEEELLSKETGAAAFLNKPVRTDVLELLVEKYLGSERPSIG